MLYGIVKFFNPKHGYGFISLPDGRPDVFVHATEVARSPFGHLTPGMPVAFEVADGKDGKGPRAVNLRNA